MMTKKILIMLGIGFVCNVVHAMDDVTKYISSPDAASLAALAAAHNAVEQRAQWPDFWCAICNAQQSGQKEVDLKQHWATKHSKCRECGHEFDSLGALRLHEVVHFTQTMVKPQDASTK